LSSFYFDIRKDTLYCDDLDSIKRSNCVSVLKISLYFLMKWLNPILAFTIEEVFQTLKKSETNNSSEFEESIFLIDFKKIDYRDKVNFNNERWELLRKLKDDINLILEKMRNEKIIKSGLETEISILIPEKLNHYFKDLNLSDFLVCSKVNINHKSESSNFKKLSNIDDIKVLVKKASGSKCEHCWKISEETCERKNCPIK